MTINRYRASSLKAAIEKARADLGPEAKVIHVRQLDEESDGNGGENVEIIAAIDSERDAEVSTSGEHQPKTGKRRSSFVPRRSSSGIRHPAWSVQHRASSVDYPESAYRLASRQKESLDASA